MYVKSICDEIDDLINAGVTTSSTQFKDWYDKAEKYILDNYGDESDEYDAFKDLSFFPDFATSSTLDTELVNACREGLERAKKLFCA